MTDDNNIDDMCKNFHLQEFSLLRSKIDNTVSRSENLIILLSVASGTIVYLLYPFILRREEQVNFESYFITSMAWLPFIISLAGYLHFRELRKGIHRIGAYIRKLEEIFAKEGLGWERQWIADRGRTHVRLFSAMTLGYFFLFLFSGSFGALSTWLMIFD